MKQCLHYCLSLLLFVSLYSCDKTPQPTFISVEPEMGSSGELIVLKGGDIGEIRELLFDDLPIPFNTAYNSDVALLFRIPDGTPLGPKTVTVRTDGGSFTFPFTVSEEPPSIRRFYPRSADIGQTITILGKNFFEPPLIVWFRTETVLDEATMLRDSVAGNIVFASVDSLVVEVPEGAASGRLGVEANGGLFKTAIDFFTFRRTLIADFDGNGYLSDNNALRVRGLSLDQRDVQGLIRSSPPAGVDGKFLKLSGQKTGGGFIGVVDIIDAASRDSLGFAAELPNVFVEVDVHNNNRSDSYLSISFQEKEGRPGDFTSTVKLTGTGWNTLRLPLSGFKNLNNQTIDPGKINAFKLALIDEDRTGRRVEANVDNLIILEER